MRPNVKVNSNYAKPEHSDPDFLKDSGTILADLEMEYLKKRGQERRVYVVISERFAMKIFDSAKMY